MGLNAMKGFRHILPVVPAALLLLAGGAGEAAQVRVDVTAQDTRVDESAPFSYPIITFSNLSDAGYLVTGVALTGGFFDWVGGPEYAPPAGGTATATGGTQLIFSGNPNDGCNAVSFALTGFDPGDSFTFGSDPEPNNCSNAVYDWRQRLDPDAVTADVLVTGPGIVGTLALTGTDWVQELIDPQGPNTYYNQRYRLSLTATINEEPVGTPEPASLAVLALGLAGLGLARRRG